MAGGVRGWQGVHGWQEGRGCGCRACMACGAMHGLRGGGGTPVPNPRSQYGYSYFKMLILRHPFGGPQILFDACSGQRLLIGGSV